MLPTRVPPEGQLPQPTMSGSNNPLVSGLSMPIMNQVVPSVVDDDEYNLSNHTRTGFPIPRYGRRRFSKTQSGGTPESGRLPKPEWWR